MNPILCGLFSAAICIFGTISTSVRAQVGIVRTVEGDVKIFSGAQECAPRYGLDLDEGDGVRTGPKSWALLNMMDGTKITVRPDTELRIDAYRYTEAGESAQNRALLGLSNGALRVVTGRIAAGRNTGFRVQTPDASVDLQGIDHDVVFAGPKYPQRGDAPAGTYGKSYTGDAVMKNPHGEVRIRAGQVGYAEPKVRASPRVLAGPEPYFYHWHDYIDRRAATIAGQLEAVVP